MEHNNKKTQKPGKKVQRRAASNVNKKATLKNNRKKRNAQAKVKTNKKKTPAKKYVYYRDAQGNLRRKVVKPKRNYKRLKRIAIILVVVIFGVIYGVTQRDSIALSKIGYNRKERKVILAQTDDEIQEYLNTETAIDFSIWDEYSNDQHYYDYELYESKNPELAEISVIHYVDSFYDIYDELEILGFTKDFCRKHWDSWSIDQFNEFVDNRIDYETVEEYLQYDEAVLDDLAEYIKSDYDGIEAVMHISYDFVDSNNSTKDTYYIEDCENTGILLKEGFTINEYEPDDLVECNVTTDSSYYGNFEMTKEAATNFEKLMKAAKKAGHNLLMQDAYISYDEYKQKFESASENYGAQFARTQLGTPGSNEHQTGLAVDVTSEAFENSDDEDFRETDAYKWLCEHACDYGFIVRYPSGKDDITGVSGDVDNPKDHCHLRYVGKEMAQDITDMDMTLEEYILTYGFGYDISIIEDDDD